MKYLAAYALAWLGGKNNPSSADIQKIFDAAEIDYNPKHIEEVCEKLKDSSLNEIVSSGIDKIGSVSLSGGAAPAGGEATAKQEAVEEKPKEESEEEDLGGAMDLFGGDDDDW